MLHTYPSLHILPLYNPQQEAQLRAQLKAEYEAQQAAIQAEPLAITYSYWNGSGHRREVVIRKGDSVGVFLAHVKEQLNKDFREVRYVFLFSARTEVVFRETMHNTPAYDIPPTKTPLPHTVPCL